MRAKLTLFAVTAAAVGSAFVLATPAANARPCPPGTTPYTIYLPTGQGVGACRPGQQCDPGPCDPTAVPKQ